MLPQTTKNPELFYIQDTRQIVGNAILWWGTNSNGYTTDIKKAGKYTREQAAKICERKTDKAWTVDYIDGNEKANVTMIDAQFLDFKKRVSPRVKKTE